MANNRQKKWIFTLNELDAAQLPSGNDLQEFLNKYAAEGVFGLEKAPTTGRNHFQGRFELESERVGQKELLNILAEGYDRKGWTVSPEWQTKESIDYCKKDGEFWYLGASAPYAFPDLDMGLHPWQETLISIAKTPFHGETERLVWYLEDTIGGIGKSKFTKWLCVKEKELNGYMLPDGSVKQMEACVCSRVNKMKKPPAVVIYDKTRTVDAELNEAATWQAIERIKSGFVSDPMYGSGEVAYWTPPTVFVFSNFKPDKKKLSLDRWVFIGVNRYNQLFIDSSLTEDPTIEIVKKHFPDIHIKTGHQRMLDEVYNSDKLCYDRDSLTN